MAQTSVKLVVGIVGGTGLDQDSSILKNKEMITVPDTPFGKPSNSEVIKGKIDDVDVYILARHGRQHNINPSNINYRANLWTLKQLGCTHVLATTACGSLKEHLAPGHLGVLDQYIDRTCIRTGRSFYKVSHIPQPRPFDPTLQEIYLKSAKELNFPIHPGLTAVCIEGPRYSTYAESKLFQSWNADLVNMTLVPEVPLACELGLVYASLSMVTDYDCWHPQEEAVTVEIVEKNLKEAAKKAKAVLVRSISHIKKIDWTPIIEKKRAMAKAAIMAE